MSTDRRDPDTTPALQDEFWGEQAEWTPQRRPAVERQRAGATIGRWWSGFLGGDSVAERTHGTARTASTMESPSGGELDEHVTAGSSHVDEHVTNDRDDPIEDDVEASGDAWTLEREPRPGRTKGIDPLLARFGGLAIIVTLAAPIVVGFASTGSGAAGAGSLATISSPPPVEVTTMQVHAATDAPLTDSTGRSTAAGSQVGPPAAAGVASSLATDDGSAESAAITAATTELASPDAALLETSSEPVTTAATVTTPPCGARYELAAGDYWIRIADAADVGLADLLAVNDSSVDTVLVPGRSICLPVGAATPSPPTTPGTTSPATTPAATPTATTAAAPSRPTATTVAPAPTTTSPPRPAAVPASQAAAIIRDVWPDDLEERALDIAWRESNHRSNVNNSCCYGLFQIHWIAHRGWLATVGVTSVSQLYDPLVNANAAYLLYQRSGGFGPWGG